VPGLGELVAVLLQRFLRLGLGGIGLLHAASIASRRSSRTLLMFGRRLLARKPKTMANGDQPMTSSGSAE